MGSLGPEAKPPDLPHSLSPPQTLGPSVSASPADPEAGFVLVTKPTGPQAQGWEGPLLPDTHFRGLWSQVQVHSSIPQGPGCALVLTLQGLRPSPLLAQPLDPSLLQLSWASPQGLPCCPPAPQPGRPTTSRFPEELLHHLTSSTYSPDRGSPQQPERGYGSKRSINTHLQ